MADKTIRVPGALVQTVEFAIRRYRQSVKAAQEKAAVQAAKEAQELFSSVSKESV